MSPVNSAFTAMLTCLLFLWSLSAMATEEGGAPSAEAVTKYTCPMHPHYIADEMGTCPICGMDLVSIEHEQTSGMDDTGDLERAIVTVPAETIQNMGIRYSRAEPTLFGRRVRAYGIVAENERMRSEVSSRVAGWVESLAVTAVGDEVKRGNLLYHLFSPELVAAQRDYLSAMERSSEKRIHSAAVRLAALGVSDTFVDTLTTSKEVVERVPFYAEADGTVSELRVSEGAYVRPGETLVVTQDYTTVWINAAVAEKDLAAITLGTPVRVMLPNLPGKEINTEVDYIYPTVDSSSRTGTVRLQLFNRKGLLRPGAYADLLFEVGMDRRLAVPDSALLFGADGAYLVVALDEGRFQPRKVTTGLSSGGMTEVTGGLEGDERIVVSGQFLIDSESTLRESFQKLQRLKLDLADLSLGKREMAMMDHLIDAGLYLHEALVDGYDVTAEQLQPAREIRDMLWPKFGLTRLGPILDHAEQAIAAAQQARTESALLDALHQLTTVLQPWVLEGKSAYYRDKGVQLWRDASDGRLWLQHGGQAYSPYSSGNGVLIQ